jgi:streptogrisin C
MWIDQEGGGLLNIASTTPATVGLATANLPDKKSVRAPQVRWSLRQLETTRDRLDKSINTNFKTELRRAEVEVDVTANSVAVYQRAGAAETHAGAQDLRKVEERPVVAAPDIDGAVQKVAGRAVVRQFTFGQEKSGGRALLDSPVDTTSCAPAECSPPMRGGMRINVNRTKAKPVYPTNDNLNAWWGECTNGFNMTDQRGWNYIMTAGHCMVGTYNIGINQTYSKYGTPVSTEVFNFENGCSGSSCGSTYPYDYSIQPYTTTSSANYYDFWAGPYAKNRVLSYCWWSTSSWTGCQEGSYGIRGLYSFNTVGSGWIVCGTGSGDGDPNSGYHRDIGYANGTRCGAIVMKADGGYMTDICTREGDSGGPLFSEIDSMAYGILSNGYTGVGACPAAGTNPGYGPEWSKYSPIDKIISHVNQQTVNLENVYYGFSLRVNP